MKKFIEDTLLMLLGALITMLIIGLGELPTLSFETLIQLSLAVGLGFFIRFVVNKTRKPKLVLNKLDSISEGGELSKYEDYQNQHPPFDLNKLDIYFEPSEMVKYAVKFEDTTINPDRGNNGKTSLGLPIELLPPELEIYEKQFFDKSCKHLSGVLVDFNTALKLRYIAGMNGTNAMIRDCKESYWQDKITLSGTLAYTPSSDC